MSRGSYKGISGYGRPYYDSIMNPTKEQQDKQFQKYLAIGREAERYVDKVLTSQGFHVTDISNRQQANGQFFPFDLYATAPNGTHIVIQVKRQSMEHYYIVYKGHLGWWEEFKVNADKLLVIIMHGRPDSYIRIPDIESAGVSSKPTSKIYKLNFNVVKPLEHLVNDYI